MKIKIDYPTPQEELQLLQNIHEDEDLRKIRVGNVLDTYLLQAVKQVLKEMQVDQRILAYIIDIVSATREKDTDKTAFAHYINVGASPRASISLLICSKVHALFQGRSFVLPEDVKAVAHRVLRHRINLSYEAEAEELDSDKLIDIILDTVSMP